MIDAQQLDNILMDYMASTEFLAIHECNTELL